MSSWINKLMAGALLVLSATSVQSATLNVPGDHATIQAAITAAAAGDTINVAAGTYVETIGISKDNLTIQSVSGDPEDTIIQADVKNQNVVEITSCSGVTLSGFTVMGSVAISDAEVWGVKMEDTQNCLLSNVVITEIETTSVTHGGLSIGVSDQEQRLSSGNSFESVTILNITGPDNSFFNHYGISMGLSDGNTFTGTTISNLNNGYIQAITVIDSYNNTFETTLISDVMTDIMAIGIYLMQYSPYSAYNNSFTNTTINNVTAKSPVCGIYAQAHATDNSFTTTTISNITSQTSSARGIYAYGSNDDNTFKNTKITHITASAGVASGIYFNSGGNSDNVFDTTTITSIAGQSEAYGVYLYKLDSNNTFTSTDISDVTASSGDSCGIKLQYDVTGNSFAGGSISGAKYGVYLLGSVDDGDASNNSIHSSNISGNSDYGVLNDNVSASFDAASNYWGSASPDFDETIAGSVLFAPFYSDEAMTQLKLTAPDNLSAFDLDRTSFLVDWDAVNDATSYQIDVDNDNLFVDSIIDNLDVGNVLIKSVTGLSPNSDYYVRVRTVSDGFISPNSTVLGPITTLPEPSLSILSLLLIITVIRKIKNIR